MTNRPRRQAMLDTALSVVRSAAATPALDLYWATCRLRDAFGAAGFLVEDRLGSPVRVSRSFAGRPEQVVADVTLALVRAGRATGGSGWAGRRAMADALAARGIDTYYRSEDSLTLADLPLANDLVRDAVRATHDAWSYGNMPPDYVCFDDFSMPCAAVPIYGEDAALDYEETTAALFRQRVLEQARKGWHEATAVVPVFGVRGARVFLDAMRLRFAGAECFLDGNRVFVIWEEAQPASVESAVSGVPRQAFDDLTIRGHS